MKQTGQRLRSCEQHPLYRTGCDDCKIRDASYQVRRQLMGGARRSAPADITAGRLRELRASGYSLPLLAAETGLEPETVKVISLGRMKFVHLRTYWAVERAYARLRDVPGPSVRAASAARRRGWSAPEPPPPPDDWDGVDPLAVERAANGERGIPLNRREKAAVWELLEKRGLSARQIADLLGVTPKSVTRWRSGESNPVSRRLPRRAG